MLRLVVVAIKSIFSPKKNLDDTCTLKMRVWLNDIDLNFHMNNAKYLTMGTLGRLWYARRTGLFSAIRKAGLGLVIVGTHITYHKSLLPFSTYQLKTKMVGWDESWFYFEQRFEQKDKVVARLLVRMVFMKSGKRLNNEQAALALGLSNVVRTVDPEISKRLDPIAS
jgi:acyl-CoA thioesterase FadM